METGAVAIAEPDVDDSRIVGMQQPRKPLTPRAQFGKPIFCSSPTPMSAASRYIPTLFRRRGLRHGPSRATLRRRDDEHGPNSVFDSPCSAFRRRTRRLGGDRYHCSPGSRITPIKLERPGMAVAPETDFLTSATRWKGGEHQTEHDQQRIVPGSPREMTFARRTRERVLGRTANRTSTARGLRTEGFSF